MNLECYIFRKSIPWCAFSNPFKIPEKTKLMWSSWSKNFIIHKRTSTSNDGKSMVDRCCINETNQTFYEGRILLVIFITNCDVFKRAQLLSWTIIRLYVVVASFGANVDTKANDEALKSTEIFFAIHEHKGPMSSIRSEPHVLSCTNSSRKQHLTSLKAIWWTL